MKIIKKVVKKTSDAAKIVVREADIATDFWWTKAEKDYYRRTGKRPPYRF